MAGEEQLSVTGMDPSLTHESLVSLSEKLAELKKQAAPLKKKLDSYLDLTPSPSLARVKIEEAKRELSCVPLGPKALWAALKFHAGMKKHALCKGKGLGNIYLLEVIEGSEVFLKGKQRP
uniref:Uncharacterized protein n=1 Tax=Sphaerodactylus townsendi TaxID=933632 RepID=A0ACB8ENW4_9SAUR